MTVTIEAGQSSKKRAVPRHHLLGPYHRHYEFIPVEGGVIVRRWEGDVMVREEDLFISAARSRWAWLKKLGYEEQ